METYHNMLLDMTETGIKYSSLCYKLETYLDENHEITNDEGFAYCYMSLKKFEDFNVRYFKIAKSLTRVEVGNDSITVNFDKNFEKEYNMYRLFVNLINYRFRILEEKYGIHKEEQEEK